MAHETTDAASRALAALTRCRTAIAPAAATKAGDPAARARAAFERCQAALGAAACKGQWSTAYINELPDDAFLFIEDGGKKDGEGKTMPRSLRHFPVRDKDGKLDVPHVENAIAQAPKSKLPKEVIDRVQAEGRRLLADAKKADDAPASAPPSELPPKLVDFGGVPVLVDRPKGFVQTKTDDAGNVLWTRTYSVNYGYLAGTEGGDHEGLDVFCGPNPAATTVWWVVQIRDDNSFDEYKLMLGFDTEEDARATYTEHVPEKYLGGIFPMPVDRVRSLLGLPIGNINPTTKRAAPAGVTKLRAVLKAIWTGLGCDVCGFGSVEDTDKFDPKRPCPECGIVAAPTAKVVKVGKAAAPDEQYVLGIVLEPDVVDLQGDTYDAATIRASAYEWLAHYRNTDYEHKFFINDKVDVVESWVVPEDTTIAGVPIKAGTWMLGVIVKDPDLWAQIKSGGITGFSINGVARKVPLT